MNRKIKNKKFGKAFSQKLTTTVQQNVLSLYLSHSCKLQFIGESAMEAGLWQKPFSTVRLCFSSLRQFIYGIYGLMRTSSHAHIYHKWMRGFRLSRKAQAEKTKKNTRLQEDVWTKQIEKKANRMSCGFRGAGPISWNPLQAAKQRSCGYVRTSTHIVPRRDTDASVIRNFVPVFCNGRLRGYGETP